LRSPRRWRGSCAVSLIAGPVQQPTPAGVERVDVETAAQMQAALQARLPADAAVMAAAVADWRVEPSGRKAQEERRAGFAGLRFVENPDLLAELAAPSSGRGW
jgi:phosphopantothenoylcysteine decarboxylase/phosphopantothenate--cysteine ligase